MSKHRDTWPCAQRTLSVAAAALFCANTLAEPTTPGGAPGLERTSNDWFDGTVTRYLNNETPKILGGKVAAVGAYPWQVSLGVAAIQDPARAHFCGGAIVNEYWIRTAAHCLTRLSPDRISVVSGSNILATGVERTPVELLIIHKDYNKPHSHDNDIALMKLSRPLVLDKTRESIKLAPSTHLLKDRQKLHVSGWGATREGGSAVADLRFVEVPFVTNEDCNDRLSYNGAVTSNMLCAGADIGGKDSCQGDSGGPLVDMAGAVQVGIVSWGEGCAKPGKFGVYADGRQYQTWEDDCIKKPGDCK